MYKKRDSEYTYSMDFAYFVNDTGLMDGRGIDSVGLGVVDLDKALASSFNNSSFALFLSGYGVQLQIWPMINYNFRVLSNV